jgi:hypothetical protein
VLEAYAKVHECDTTSEMVPWHTPFDGGIRYWDCFAYKGCKTANGTDAKLGTVAQCLWDGYHGDWPANGTIAKMSFWWLKNHVLNEDTYVDPPERPLALPPTPTTPLVRVALAQHW